MIISNGIGISICPSRSLLGGFRLEVSVMVNHTLDRHFATVEA